MDSSILECIRTVGRGERGRKPLSFEQAYTIMSEYLDGHCDADQMAMLLMLIRVQNETHDEIAGFVRAFQPRIAKIEADIDWPCYAGKRLNLGKPWHLIAAKILAKQGQRVLLHGYKDSVNHREHASDYLSPMGIERAKDAEHAQAILNRDNIAYLPLENFAPQALEMMDWRHRYGLRTPINTVVRALNPGQARFGIRGSFHPGYQELHARIEHSVGTLSHTMLSFKGQSGESEYNPKVSQTVWLSQEQGVRELYWPAFDELSLPRLQHCPLDTPEQDKDTMAKTIVSTLVAVLFTQLGERELALEKAQALWCDYITQCDVIPI